MKTYRYGLKDNGINNWYSIERKIWLIGWVEIHRFATQNALMDAVHQLKERGNVVVEMY